jgi:hypothetical protein
LPCCVKTTAPIPLSLVTLRCCAFTRERERFQGQQRPVATRFQPLHHVVVSSSHSTAFYSLYYTGQHFLSLKCSTFISFNPFLSCTISYFHHFIFLLFLFFFDKVEKQNSTLRKVTSNLLQLAGGKSS